VQESGQCGGAVGCMLATVCETYGRELSACLCHSVNLKSKSSQLTPVYLRNAVIFDIRARCDLHCEQKSHKEN